MTTLRPGTTLCALTAATLALAAACGAPGVPAPSPSSVVQAPDPTTVPALPQGRPLLTLTGRIDATNAAGALHLDQAELDRLGVQEMTVDDPWAKHRVTLRGCWLRDVVALARPDPGATTLHLHALDDYQVDLKLADVRTLNVFLASRTAQGAALPVEDGGPTRVVFADDLAGRFSPDLWIWNIDTVDVR